MVKKEPVSVNWQSLFIIIPIVDLWASYRVEKLRLYLLFAIALAATEATIEVSIFGFDAFLEDPEEWDNRYILQGLFIVFGIGIAVGLIRMWSKKWNEQFS